VNLKRLLVVAAAAAVVAVVVDAAGNKPVASVLFVDGSNFGNAVVELTGFEVAELGLGFADVIEHCDAYSVVVVVLLVASSGPPFEIYVPWDGEKPGQVWLG